jgi:ABC-type cobalamin/Fe3+-siderophores transport system ATPase subunit
MILKIENLTFGWQQETLFENISNHLNQKEIVQLSGENGSGKTTLLQIISGMIEKFFPIDCLCPQHQSGFFFTH